MGGQVFGVGITGHVLTELEKRILRENPPYAVVLFGRNVGGERQLKDLVSAIKSIAPIPPLIMIDEEGGRVDRLRELLPGLPGAEALSECENALELTQGFGAILGMALRYFDIDINLAPVVDIRREPVTKGLERRCFGATPERVVQLAGEFVRGQASAGTASCLKHFPGIGGGTGDPHYGATVIDVSLEQLKAEDLNPYLKLANEAAAVMIGHGTYPRIEEPDLPATLSYKISTELLRDVVGFEGIAFSDDMEMHAVADLGSYERLAERALMAGNDVILFCSHIERVPSLLSYMSAQEKVDPGLALRYEESVRRAEDYREFCARLRREATIPVPGFGELEEHARRFVEGFEKAHDEAVAVGSTTERRSESRGPGTGKTGREEWT